MDRKVRLKDIIKTMGVGVTTAIGGIELTLAAADIGDRIAPHVEKYAGLIGSRTVEYGLPLAVGLCMFSLFYTATKATYKYRPISVKAVTK